MSERQTIDTYEGLANWYEQHYKEMGDGWNTPAEECNKHLDALGVPNDKSKLLLDIGCGAGHFLAEASKRVRCIGIDISAQVLAYAKHRLEWSGAKLAQANIESLKGDTKFDYIVSIGSLEHVLDIGKALDSIRKLLAPNGKWYFFCPNLNWKHNDQPNERALSNVGWITLFQDHGLGTENFKIWNDSTAFWGSAEPAGAKGMLPMRQTDSDKFLRSFAEELENCPHCGNTLRYGDSLADYNHHPSCVVWKWAKSGGPVSEIQVTTPTETLQKQVDYFRKRILEDVVNTSLPRPPCMLNIGSGQRPFGEPWINIDSQAKWNPHLCCDANELGDHFSEGSVDTIVMHHVLEHFGCGEADGLLALCYKLLRPGGSLIVCVPDMAALADQWNRGQCLGGKDAPCIDTQIFMTNVYGAYMGDEADRHKWGYDQTSLMQTLQKAGDWDELKMFDNREMEGARIAQDWWIMSIEAVK